MKLLILLVAFCLLAIVLPNVFPTFGGVLFIISWATLVAWLNPKKSCYHDQ